MKSTIEIVIETVELLNRFNCEMPHNYMQEVFGKDDKVLAERCLQAPKKGLFSLLRLIYHLKPDEQRALTKYINRKDKIIRY